MSKNFLFGILLASFGAVALAQTVTTSSIMVGGDRDSHGCIPSTGYSWSESSQKCVRPWEENTASTTDNSRVGCFIFLNNIKIGSRNEDVKLLQEKLFDKGYIKVNPTGYFGALTLKAVKQYQKDNGIENTGFVGEKTRGILRNHFCNIIPIDDTQYKEAPKNCKVWFDGCNNCVRSEEGSPMACTKMACLTSKFTPSCKEYFDNTYSPSPVIKSFSGATTLKVGEKGIWNISANISDNSRLTYEVIWGDEVYMSYANSITSKLTRPEVVTQNTTFEHIYNEVGTYTVIVKVISENGKEIKTSQTVTVVKSDTSDTCKVWYDGCNTCSRAYPGAPMACTLMACMQNSVSYCKESFDSSSLIKACPTEIITNMMPVMCIKAPCPAQPRDSYYIYNGVRYEIDQFNADYVKNNCTVKETKVY